MCDKADRKMGQQPDANRKLWYKDINYQQGTSIKRKLELKGSSYVRIAGIVPLSFQLKITFKVIQREHDIVVTLWEICELKPHSWCLHSSSNFSLHSLTFFLQKTKWECVKQGAKKAIDQGHGKQTKWPLYIMLAYWHCFIVPYAANFTEMARSNLTR